MSSRNRALNRMTWNSLVRGGGELPTSGPTLAETIQHNQDERRKVVEQVKHDLGVSWDEEHFQENAIDPMWARGFLKNASNWGTITELEREEIQNWIDDREVKER